MFDFTVPAVTAFASAKEAVNSALVANSRSGAYVVGALRAALQHVSGGDYRAANDGDLQALCQRLVVSASEMALTVEFDRQSFANLIKGSLPAALKGTLLEGWTFSGGIDDVTDVNKKGAKATHAFRDARFMRKGTKGRDVYRVSWVGANAPTKQKVDPLDIPEACSGLLAPPQASTPEPWEKAQYNAGGYLEYPRPQGDCYSLWEWNPEPFQHEQPLVAKLAAFEASRRRWQDRALAAEAALVAKPAKRPVTKRSAA